MKVELSIADDRELRQVIRSMIEGEVTSIARGEIKTIIRDVFDRKAAGSTADEAVGRILRDEIGLAVKRVLGGRWDKEAIKEIAREIINERLGEFFKDTHGKVA